MTGADGGPIVVGVDAAIRECRRVLSETAAGRTAQYPSVELRHEVVPGGFTGMLLGSVSQGVPHHARCPVITVPA